MSKQRSFLYLGGLLAFWMGLSICTTAFAKKDFRGLFGSYRRSKYTENEGNASDFGLDLMLSTMIPVTSIVNSTENPSVAAVPMATATFFNVEGQFFFTLNYNWEIFANFGYNTYDTRKQSDAAAASLTEPIYHQFSMEAFPLLLGLKYRFSREDIVPYVGLGAGMSFVTRKATYDNDSNTLQVSNLNAVTGELIVGVEFFFAPRMGIRLETSAYYMNLPSGTFDPSNGTNAPILPIFVYQPNPISVRYASGLFFLF